MGKLDPPAPRSSRDARLAAALRENLKKRKAQARAREAGQTRQKAPAEPEKPAKA